MFGPVAGMVFIYLRMGGHVVRGAWRDVVGSSLVFFMRRMGSGKSCLKSFENGNGREGWGSVGDCV